jgi:hypothetical protein
LFYRGSVLKNLVPIEVVTKTGSLSTLLGTRMRKEESDPSNKSTKNTNKHSLKSLGGWNDFWRLGEALIF